MEHMNRIRLVFLCVAFVCVGILAFGGGYYYNGISHVKVKEEQEPREYTIMEEPEEEIPVPAADSLQSAVMAEPYKFMLGERDGEVVCYSYGETEPFLTGISMDSLPEELQEELQIGKPIYSEEELYNFLESYSS